MKKPQKTKPQPTLLTQLMETCKWFQNIRIYSPTILTENPRSRMVSAWPQKKSPQVQSIKAELLQTNAEFPSEDSVKTYFCPRTVSHHHDQTAHQLNFQRFRHLRNYFTMELIRAKIAATKSPLEVKLEYKQCSIPFKHPRFNTKNTAYLDQLLEMEDRDEFVWCLKAPTEPWKYSIKVHFTQARLLFGQEWFPKLPILLEKKTYNQNGKDRQYVLQANIYAVLPNFGSDL